MAFATSPPSPTTTSRLPGNSNIIVDSLLSTMISDDSPRPSGLPLPLVANVTGSQRRRNKKHSRGFIPGGGDVQ